ncbi:MAG: RDD family protein [Acidobacteria bacterium]|nr:RDD family protein [Acidobacteriota bacterium]
MDQGSRPRGQANAFRPREKIVNFVPETVKAPFLLRCGATLLDYSFAVLIPVVSMLLGRLAGFDGALNAAGWIAAVILGLSNVVLLPMFAGQSIGKIITGIRIVQLDGGQPSYGTIAFRQTLGYLLTIACAGVGFVLSLFSRKGRALHDYVTNTVVIYADKRPKL